MSDTLRRVRTSARPAETAVPEAHGSGMDGTARDLLREALAACAGRMELPDTQAVVDRLRGGDGAVCGCLHYAIAARVAAYLGEQDRSVKDAYVFEFDAASDEVGEAAETPTSPVLMIVWAEPRTAALDALIGSLDAALTRSYAELAGAPDLARLLDAHVIGDADVKARAGFGALLSARYRRPLRVWAR